MPADRTGPGGPGAPVGGEGTDADMAMPLPVHGETGFTEWLARLTAVLDPGAGWYGVFLRRDAEGLRACVAGTELPPWDVVEALLQDLAALRGPDAADAELPRARALHTRAAAARDRRPGGRPALRGRRAAMERERDRAAAGADRVSVLLGTVAEGSAEAARLAGELAWLRDDHARASARLVELDARLAALGPEPAAVAREAAGPEPAPAVPGPEPLAPGPEPAAVGPGPGVREPEAAVPGPEAAALAGPRLRSRSHAARGAVARKRPRGARYAWLDADAAETTGDTDAPAVPGAGSGHDPGAGYPPAPRPGAYGAGAAVPELPVVAALPRGARFGTVPEPGVRPPEGPEPLPEPDEADVRAVRRTVAALPALRRTGRSGEALVLLCEAARWPAGRLVALAAGLEAAGLAADWGTLLWEAAALPPDRLVALAGALGAAGRAADARGLLRQGVARPAAETAAAVLALAEGGSGAHAWALVDAVVRFRAPEEAARLAGQAPDRLVPLVLAAARAASPDREADLVHALRVAGLAAG